MPFKVILFLKCKCCEQIRRRSGSPDAGLRYRGEDLSSAFLPSRRDRDLKLKQSINKKKQHPERKYCPTFDFSYSESQGGGVNFEFFNMAARSVSAKQNGTSLLLKNFYTVRVHVFAFDQ